jgi:hypothetical protein
MTQQRREPVYDAVVWLLAVTVTFGPIAWLVVSVARGIAAS